ncbi:guanylate kinase [Deinococcus peraridilitoris DSM 19664]|uniref:Guanylate kinase n=2 Tax=Deinococcus TaxID=1298 RepID=L0A2T1_DEIPD|nr:guanylate kinase [Deinococcus peraridilitoris DSM 19664]
MLEGMQAEETPAQIPAEKRGLLIVVSGASGVGKNTLCARLMQRIPMHFSVSWTTREKRPSEVDGQDYHFRTRDEFLAELEQGQGFLEHAEFVGNMYGTPRAPLERALDSGEHVLLDIEIEGAMQVAELAPEAVLIFIMPPSLTELRSRLLGRATESPDKIEKRLQRARRDIRLAQRFHYIVMNDNIDVAVSDLEAIVRTELLRAHRVSERELAHIVDS